MPGFLRKDRKRLIIFSLDSHAPMALASERMAMADSSQFVPAERLYEELGITQDDLDTVGDVDIE